MQHILTPQEARALDTYMIETLEIPGILLMEQAASAVADAAIRQAGGGKILVVCGGGNNGGDGWAAARILLTRGYSVQIGYTSLNLPPDAAANMRFFTHTSFAHALTEENAEDFFSAHRDASVVIDALFGTGLSRVPEGLYAKMIGLINGHPGYKIAVDIPSGVFGGTGQGDIAVEADETVTFQCPKPGHFLYPGRHNTGRLTVAPIGIASGFPMPALVHMDGLSLPERTANSNKGTYGRLHILAGSQGMSGAAILCARGAIRAGAGSTALFSCSYTVDKLQATVPTALALPIGDDSSRVRNASPDALLSHCTAVAAGPGLGNHGDLRGLLSQLAVSPLPKVLDADALNILSADVPAFCPGTVLTPHPKEFSRLSGKTVEEILADPIGTARAYAAAHGVILLLKGATTVVTDGQSTCLVTAGSPAMAKGGSGDVLTGVIGGLLAQGISPFEAACAGAYLCGKAGETAAAQLGVYAPSAEDTLQYLRP